MKPERWVTRRWLTNLINEPWSDIGEDEAYSDKQKKKFKELDFIKRRIYDARDALSELDFARSRHIYVEVMATYNELNDKDKAKVYGDIKELYEDRKHAEARFGGR